MKHKFAG